MKNNYLELEITNQIIQLENFKNICKLSTKKDDNKTDKDEQKILNKINSATNKYIKELNKIIK